jgi:hypothetical protein
MTRIANDGIRGKYMQKHYAALEGLMRVPSPIDQIKEFLKKNGWDIKAIEDLEKEVHEKTTLLKGNNHE